MNTPSNKEAQNVTFSDFGMTTGGLHVIAKDGSNEAVAEVVPEYKNIVLTALNFHPAESAERERLIERLNAFCEQNLPDWVSPENREGFVGGVRYASMIVADHLRGNEND